MNIKGLNKTTLLDYPGLVAATIFLGGCSFCCPFCHNRSLVIHPEKIPDIPASEVYDFLRKRRGVLDGVCVTGGEPTLHPGLPELLYTIKCMGYRVKLDTNGYDPVCLDHLIKDELVDYVAMDIKNSLDKYARTAGFPDMDLARVRLSADILMEGLVDYEFRTTVVHELHSIQDMEAIGQWLAGAKAYYLQPYVESDDVIMPIFSSCGKEELEQMRRALANYVKKAAIRGMD